MVRTTLLVWSDRQAQAWRSNRHRPWVPRCRRLAQGALEDMERRYRRNVFAAFPWRPRSTPSGERLALCRRMTEMWKREGDDDCRRRASPGAIRTDHVA